MRRWMIVAGLTLAVGVGAGGAAAQEAAGTLPMCPLMDESANLALSIATDDGPVFFCREGCGEKYKKDPAKYAQWVLAQRKALADRPKVQVSCPVTGEPIDRKTFIEKGGKKVFFRCRDCVSKFQENPEKYKAALANSYTYQTTCPVMGEEINPKAFATIAGGQKIYFCCPGCEKKLFDDPAKYAPKLEAQGLKIDLDKIKPAEKEKAGKHHDGHDHGHSGHDHGSHP